MDITLAPRSVLQNMDTMWNNTVADILKDGMNGQENGSVDVPQQTIEGANVVPHYSYIYISASVLYGILFLAGTIGNVMVIIVVGKNTEMKTPTNWFLVNLSVADLLVILLCMPSALVEFHAKDVWLLGNSMCKLIPYLENTVAHASILIIMAISFDRYYATCHPLKVLYTCTTTRALKILCGVWAVALATTAPMISMSFLEDAIFLDGTPVKVCRTPINNRWKEAFLISSICIFFVLPLFTLSILYFRIAKKLSVDGRTPPPLRTGRAKTQANKSRKQVIQMLIVIIVFFFLCLLPIRVVTLWFVYSSLETKQNLGLESWLNLITFARIMMYTNSAINPAIYNIVSTKFRDAFLRTLGVRLSITEMRRLSVMSMQMGKSSFLMKHQQQNQEDAKDSIENLRMHSMV